MPSCQSVAAVVSQTRFGRASRTTERDDATQGRGPRSARQGIVERTWREQAGSRAPSCFPVCNELSKKIYAIADGIGQQQNTFRQMSITSKKNRLQSGLLTFFASFDLSTSHITSSTTSSVATLLSPLNPSPTSATLSPHLSAHPPLVHLTPCPFHLSPCHLLHLASLPRLLLRGVDSADAPHLRPFPCMFFRTQPQRRRGPAPGWTPPAQRFPCPRSVHKGVADAAVHHRRPAGCPPTLGPHC